jgi:outer membrane murein-binding lipoprotein Lpp
MACSDFKPDHNGECLTCDEDFEAHYVKRGEMEALDTTLQTRIAELEQAVLQLTAEYHAAIGEQSYAGTRLDWIERARAAEARVADLERDHARDLDNYLAKCDAKWQARVAELEHDLAHMADTYHAAADGLQKKLSEAQVALVDNQHNYWVAMKAMQAQYGEQVAALTREGDRYLARLSELEAAVGGMVPFADVVDLEAEVERLTEDRDFWDKKAGEEHTRANDWQTLWNEAHERVQELEREVARLLKLTMVNPQVPNGCSLCSREHEADCDLAFATCTCKAPPDSLT